MTWFRFLIGFQPFHDAPIRANLRWREAGAFRDQLVAKDLISVENSRRFDAGTEQVAHQLLKHCRPHADGSLLAIWHLEMILRRVGRRDDTPVMGRPPEQD